MRRNVFWMLLFSLVGVCLLAKPCVALANLYTYTDSNGVVSMTNNLKSVPKKYRATMTVEREAPKPKQVEQPVQSYEPAASGTSAAPPAQAPAGKFAELSARFPWFKPLVYLFGIFAALLLLIKVTSQLSSPHLSKVIYLSFFLGVSVFLYKSYVTHVVDSSMKIKEQTVEMMKKSSQRELPAVTDEVDPVSKQ